MKLHTLVFTAAFLLAAGLTAPAAHAQGAPAMASAADVQAMIAKSRAMPPKPTIVTKLVAAGSSEADIEYRAAPGSPPTIHDTRDELIYVIEGAANFTLGGKLVNARHTDPTNQAGTDITGGKVTHIAKGDFIMVGAGTPHKFMPDAGVGITFMTFHVDHKG